MNGRYALACGVALAAAAPADAATLHYELTGVDIYYGGEIEHASFDLDEQPDVLSNNAGLDANFRLKFISGVFQYGNTIKTLQDVVFFNQHEEGGFAVLDTDIPGNTPNIDSYYLLSVLGEQLFSGPETNPTLLTGSFTLLDEFSGSPIAVNVTSVAPVPEPATWAMMIAGFGMIGAGLRRRRHRPSISVAWA